MQKWVKDGKVAVIVSPEYGAGWSTWGKPESCMDGELAQAIEAKSPDISAIAEKNWPGEYQGGLKACAVCWVPQGEQFEITEYDGAESLTIIGQQTYLVA